MTSLSGFSGLLDMPLPVLPKQNRSREVIGMLELTIEKNVKPSIQKEISDAVLEIIKEVKIESRNINKKINFSKKDRMIYNLLKAQNKILDYSKLGYGKIAQPLAINFDYKQYEQNEKKDEIIFCSNETISNEEINEIIEEKAYADLLGMTSTSIKPGSQESFKWWKLFNNSLNILKYEWVSKSCK